jgi:hypothetical protein
MNYLTNYYKNLSEQLQERVNHLQKLLESSEPVDMAPELHSEIVKHVVDQHVKNFPHINSNKPETYGKPDISASVAHAEKFLNSHPEAPFSSPEQALKALHKSGAFESNAFMGHIEDLKGQGPEEDQRRISTQGMVDDYISDLAHSIGEVMEDQAQRN